MIILGKNRISKITDNNKIILGSNKFYDYNYLTIKKKTKLKFKSSELFLYILNSQNKKEKIKIKEKIINFKKNDLFRIIKNKLEEIEIDTDHKINILIVHKENAGQNKRNISIKKINKIYSVKKPWGYEKWLTGDSHKNYAFKKIFLKKGTKTSLQYHVKKIETNFLFNGNAKLHYMFRKIPLKKKNFSKISNSIKTKKLKSGSIINVNPKTIHRLEAISNLILFEVSSPHLSDVVRVSDVTNRPDGKIQNEHSKKLN
tara:strand:+ start:437 stop:1210 length:774 start_codon:yes stop_codon:yes gene_type:complete